MRGNPLLDSGSLNFSVQHSIVSDRTFSNSSVGSLATDLLFSMS